MIKDQRYCDELKKSISKDEEYRDSIEQLYVLAGRNETDKSVLPEINAHIEKLSKEDMVCTPLEFEGNLKKIVKEYLSKINNIKPEYPPSVCYKFIENPDFNVNFEGKLYKLVKKYLVGKGIKFTCEKDTQDEINGEERSFIKFSFARELENGPSSVIILCSENSNEIYVFTDSFLIYPINKDDVSKYGGDCIVIGEKNTNYIDEIELRDKLNKIFKKDEIEEKNESIQYEMMETKNIVIDNEDIDNENEEKKIKQAEEEFKKRFSPYGEFDNKELLPFLFFNLITNRSEELFNDYINNFRPLIDGNFLFSIPKIRDEENVFLVTCEQCLLSRAEDEPEKKHKKNYEELVKEFSSYQEVVSSYESASDKENFYREFNGKTFKMELDKIPLYLVPLYFYSYLDVETFNDCKGFLSFTEKVSDELIKNVDLNLDSKIKSRIFVNLLANAVFSGMPEILYFAEKHNIGFHSKNDFDTNLLVSFTIRAMERFARSGNLVEDFIDKPVKQINVLKFILDKCGEEIFNKMSENSKIIVGKNGKKRRPSIEFFSTKIDEWFDVFEKLNSELNVPRLNLEKNEYRNEMKRILNEITECFTKKYLRELQAVRNEVCEYNII